MSSDLAPGMVAPASLPFGPIAVWRGHSGKITANHDRCPHRGMRLSHGFIRGDTLSCIYHGWSFARDGRCTKIPAHPDLEPPASIHCGALPVVEACGVIWVSPEATDQPPPSHDGFEGLRWIELACPGSEFERITGLAREADTLTLRLADIETHLVATQTEHANLRLLVMVPDDLGPDDRIAVSRALEQFRQECEASL